MCVCLCVCVCCMYLTFQKKSVNSHCENCRINYEGTQKGIFFNDLSVHLPNTHLSELHFHLTTYYGSNINFQVRVNPLLFPKIFCLLINADRRGSVESYSDIFPVMFDMNPSCITLYANRHYLINRWRRPFEPLWQILNLSFYHLMSCKTR